MKSLPLALLALSLHLGAGATEVRKAEWIEGMKTALPTMFCQSPQYFRQCFTVTVTECEETMASATRVCLAKHNDAIPAILVQPQDGSRMGAVVGQCVGSTYEVSLIKKRISNPKCNDVNAWR